MTPNEMRDWFKQYPPHPLALPDNQSSALGFRVGEILNYGACVVRVDEFLPDGDAYVTNESGDHLVVSWNRLSR